jgi:protease-4
MARCKKATASKPMNKSFFSRLWISREVRVAILVAVLSAAGALFLASGDLRDGIWLLAIAAAIVAAFWYFVVRPARIPRDAVVCLRLSGSLPEDAHRSPLDQLLRHGALSMRQLRYGLEACASDPDVRALVIEITDIEAGLATAHEIHRLIAALRAAGKRVTAILCGDSIGMREYLAACGAGEVVANPDAMLMMLGVAMGQPFARRALERLGVGAQVLQWKEYKGAAELLSRDGMSPELRESLEAIIGDWKTLLADSIAAARSLDRARAEELVASGFLGAAAAQAAGLVDRAGYIEDIRAELDPEGKRKHFISFGRYLRHAVYRRERGRRQRIAVVFGTGPVIAGEVPPAGEFISGETTAGVIDRASRDERVRAIVFRVNSPGGSAVGSELVWRAVREAQGRGKPVVVSMGDVAGSGGYYVAMGADAIVAEPATVTGSIGVVYAKLEVSRLLERIGVHFDFARSSENSDALSFARPLSGTELEQVNAALGALYGNFTAKVAEGRRLTAEQAEALARGRVWSGVAARERGLVDELGGFSRAVEIARERARIAPATAHQLVVFSPRQPLVQLRDLIAPMGTRTPWAGDLAAAALGVPSRWAPAMIRILMRGGALLLCPFGSD